MDILTQKQETEMDTLLGKAKFKVPSLMSRLFLERKRTAYSGGFAVLSTFGADLSEIFAFLDIVCTECAGLTRKKEDASSWNYDALTDFEYPKVEDLYKKGSEWLDSFREGLGGE